ncbi:MAG: hypothetical protein RJB39_779 [Candidatus Parcubacteria bacterium]|jgi:glycosyltransferase involved in cell wall biosynthesis
MKNLIYLANVRLPSEKAHGVQITHTSEEFAKQIGRAGGSFELIFAAREKTIAEDLFEYYRLSHTYPIKKIETVHLRNPQQLFYFIQRIHFALKSLWYVSKKYDKDTYIYSRDEFLLFIYSFRFKNLVFEAHAVKTNFFFRFILKKLKRIVTISQGLKDVYTEYIPADNIHVAHDAVEVGKFKIEIDKTTERVKSGLPTDKRIVTYIGSIGLYGWKGVDTFLESSLLLPEYTFLIVGGKEKDIALLKERYQNTNTIFAGHQSPERIPVYQKISDILVIPNKSGFPESELYTSPMKLFEYMASSVPIISSDLPSMREVLNESIATFFTPNDGKDLSLKIQTVFTDYAAALAKAERAAAEVEKYTYKERVAAILRHISVPS